METEKLVISVLERCGNISPNQIHVAGFDYHAGLQMEGCDIVIDVPRRYGGTKNGSRVYIDVKAATNYLGRPLDTFAQEIA